MSSQDFKTLLCLQLNCLEKLEIMFFVTLQWDPLSSGGVMPRSPRSAQEQTLMGPAIAPVRGAWAVGGGGGRHPPDHILQSRG